MLRILAHKIGQIEDGCKYLGESSMPGQKMHFLSPK